MGEGKPFPDPLPRALRAEINLIRTLCPFWRAALLGGGSSDLEILLSYDRAHTVCVPNMKP